MSFSNKKGIVALASIFLFLFSTRYSTGQDLMTPDLSDLSRLRTMANSPLNTRGGMEVGDVNVPSITGSQREMKELPEEQPGQPMLQVLFDCNKVDPDQYIIGPDDQILLYLFGALDQPYTLTVTSEGIVNIPTIGAYEVGDKTLTEAKNIITREVNKRYKGIQISVTLARPRFFRVYVSGMVRSPGAVPVHALQRVSDVIDKAGLSVLERFQMASGGANLPPQQQQTPGSVSSSAAQNPMSLEFEAYLKRESSLRTITIHRGDQKILVDLQRFRRFGDLKCNPYVCAGDRIEVPPYVGNLFVYGQVNEPGRYEFKPGDRILDLVQFAGGISSSADTTRATLTRFDQDGKPLPSFEIDLGDALYRNPDAPQYRLMESDRLNVWRKYDYKVVANVALRGEVRYPGTYPITPNKTTLTELIKEIAGDLTPNANLEEARFIRPASTTQDLEYQRLSRMVASDMTDEEYDLFKNLSLARRGEISVDFVKLFRGGDDTNDVVLQSGDDITIPASFNFVRVMGAVEQPGAMQIKSGEGLDYYISKAGGYSWNAYKSKTRIIKGKSGQRFRPSKRIAIEDGDTIHVPEKKPIDVWAAMKDGALLFANVATVIILARQITQ